LLLLIFEIFSTKEQKGKIVSVAIVLFMIHTVIGFLPINQGTLFGGMFKTHALLYFFKNTLNIGVLILLLQSAEWLNKNVVEQNKATEFFVLLFSSLLGMYFMISAGDF
jgi:NADH-quinone oxidoreductase subunit N